MGNFQQAIAKNRCMRQIYYFYAPRSEYLYMMKNPIERFKNGLLFIIKINKKLVKLFNK